MSRVGDEDGTEGCLYSDWFLIRGTFWSRNERSDQSQFTELQHEVLKTTSQLWRQKKRFILIKKRLRGTRHSKFDFTPKFWLKCLSLEIKNTFFKNSKHLPTTSHTNTHTTHQVVSLTPGAHTHFCDTIVERHEGFWSPEFPFEPFDPPTDVQR